MVGESAEGSGGRLNAAKAALHASKVLEGAQVQFTHFWVLERAAFAFADAAEAAGAEPDVAVIAQQLLQTVAETYERTGRNRRAMRCRTRLVEVPRREIA